VAGFTLNVEILAMSARSSFSVLSRIALSSELRILLTTSRWLELSLRTALDGLLCVVKRNDIMLLINMKLGDSHSQILRVNPLILPLTLADVDEVVLQYHSALLQLTLLRYVELLRIE
jgi:hypothetical protein